METSSRNTRHDSRHDTAASASAVGWRSVGVFVALAFVISWGIWIGLRAAGVPFGLRTLLGMFGPALAALLTRLLLREGFADAGLRLAARGQRGAWRMYLAAYLLMPLLLALGLGLTLLFSVQHWALPQHLDELGRQIERAGGRLPPGMSAQQLATLSVLISALGAFTYLLPINMIATFGEEFGWRGYLLPRLAPLGGVRAALLIGIVWGLWHAPVIALDGYNFPGHPVAGVLMMVAFTTPFSLIFAWLRFRTESIWPPTLAHAALNGEATIIVLFLTRGDSLLAAPVGLMGIIPAAALALWLALTGRIKPLAPAASSPSTITASSEGMQPG